jgi:hypothetical protein
MEPFGSVIGALFQVTPNDIGKLSSSLTIQRTRMFLVIDEVSADVVLDDFGH